MLINKIIVTNYGQNSLSIIDRADLSQIKTINLQSIMHSDTGSTRVIVEENNNLLILNCDEDYLYRVDVSNSTLINQISLGRCPVRIKILGDKVYVLNIDSNSLSIINKEDLTIIESIYVGEKPTDLAIDEDGGKVFITNLNSYNISVIDISGNIYDIKLSYMPFRIKVENGIIYVLGFVNNNFLGQSIISSIDIIEGNIKWSKIISGIYFDFIKLKDMDSFYLVSSENSWLYEFNQHTGKNTKKLYIGGLTNFINNDLENLYLNDMVNDQVIIVDIKQNYIKKRIKVGIEPHDILLT